MKAVIVYQPEKANIIEVSRFSLTGDRQCRRILQSGYDYCETYARGMKAAGADVRIAYCETGDACTQDWRPKQTDPWNKDFQSLI